MRFLIRYSIMSLKVMGKSKSLLCYFCSISFDLTFMLIIILSSFVGGEIRRTESS